MSGLGLVLAGGASRGAYEAGVLRFVFSELPKRIGFEPWPSVVSGTSVGAINSAFAVARSQEGIAFVAKLWRELEMDQVLKITYGDVLRNVRAALTDRPFALADARPLQKLILRHFPGEQIRKHIDRCEVTWVVSATDLVTGTQIIFADTCTSPRWRQRPGVRIVHTQISPLHTMASAALPLLFPPVSIGEHLLVDGGLRQNTPLGPVLRAGADRVLVVSLKRSTLDQLRPEQPASLTFLAGKLLNALLLDPVEQDLYEAEQINHLIAWGTARFGEDFSRSLRQDLGMRHAEILFLTPSEDLGAMAADIYRANKPKLDGPAGRLLERAAGRSGPDADLLSYVFFDRAYTGALEALGFEDARRNEEAIARLVMPSGTAPTQMGG